MPPNRIGTLPHGRRWVRLPPNRIGTLTPCPPSPPPKRGGWRGGSSPQEPIKIGVLASLTPLPAISLRGLEGRSTRDNRLKWIALRPETHSPHPTLPPSLGEGRVGAYAG